MSALASVLSTCLKIGSDSGATDMASGCAVPVSVLHHAMKYLDCLGIARYIPVLYNAKLLVATYAKAVPVKYLVPRPNLLVLCDKNSEMHSFD